MKNLKKIKEILRGRGQEAELRMTKRKRDSSGACGSAGNFRNDEKNTGSLVEGAVAKGGRGRVP